MVLEAWILSKIADKVFSYASDKGSGIVEEWVRDKLGLEPRKKAFKRALEKASQKFEKNYPQWAADLFNDSFFEHEAAPILAQFLVQDGNPDPSELAILWARLLNIPRPERRTMLISELEPAAANFLDDMASALKAEQALSALNKSRALDQIVSELRAIRKKIDAGQATPGSRRDYLHWSIERTLYLDMRGISQIQHFIQVKLEEVYISLRAQHENTPGAVDRSLSELELAQLEGSVNLSVEEIEDRQDSLLTHEERPKNRVVVELSEVIKSYNRVVILGDPGSGKSTLLRYLALKYAQAIYDGRNETGSDLGTVRFPILIRIADYAEYGLPKGQSLSDYLVDYYSMHGCPRTGLADLLVTELAGGNCLILLDGLDEIVSADDRRKVVERVEDFIRSHDDRSNCFVITSRRAGYRSTPLGGPFVHYVVEDMNEAQIQRFLERWCVAIEATETPDLSQKARQVAAQREVDAILHAVRNFPGVHRLATNPLLLRLLAQLHRTTAQLPRRRIELYQAAAETLAHTWRTTQKVPESALIDDKYLTRLLSKLAYWLHENKPTGFATEREVYEVLGKEWAYIKGLDWNEDTPDIEIEVEKFLHAVREHTGIFVERAPKRYGFMHLTFEEYYAAWYIVRRSKDRARIIRKHLHQTRWEEPILLALGLVSPEDAEDLIETAILAQGEEAKELGFAQSSYEKFLGRDYLFALRCLEENIPVRPGVKKRLLKRMTDELLYQTGSGRFHLYNEELEATLKYLGESEAASVVSSLFIEALPSATAQVRAKIMENLGRLGHTSLQVINVLITALDDVDPKVRKLSRWSLMRLKLVHPSRELITALTEALHNKNTSARTTAVRLLGQYEQYSPDVVTALLAALHNTDPDVRSMAGWNLRSSLTMPEVVTALLAALHDTDPKVRSMAAESLGTLDRTTSQVVTALLATLRDIAPVVRKTAIESLERLGQSPLQVITTLTEALHDTDSEIRAGVVRSLGQLKYTLPSVEEAIVTVLHDTDPGVRDAVAESLRQLNQDSPRVVAAFIEALHDIDPHVRNSAARSLEKSGQVSSQIVIALIEALHDVDNNVRATAATSLRGLDQTSPEGVAALIEALHDVDFHVRRAVMMSLGHLGQKSSQAATALLEALREAATIASQEAENLEKLDQTFFQDVIALLWSLLDMGRRDTLNLVIENVKQSDQTVREVATLLIDALPFADHDIVGVLTHNLGKLGQVSPAIIRTTIDFVQTSPLIRLIPTVVAASLEQLDQAMPGVVDVLIEYLGNADPQVRELIVKGFQGSGLASPIIVQSLIRMLNDDDVAVQKAAIESLGQLDQRGISGEVVTALLISLHDPIPEIRSASVESLGNIGQKKIADEITMALFNSLDDNDFKVRDAAAERLKQLGQISPKLLDVQLEALNHRSLKWSHGDIARFLGQHGKNHEAIIQSLWEKLRDEKTYARRDYAQALALLGQGFPDVAETIGEKLAQAIEDPDLSKTDEWGWSGHDLAYEALRLLVADGEINKR